MKVSDHFRMAEHRWYIQEFNATPCLLHLGGMSAIYTCEDTLGYRYTNILNLYENDYCQMYYDRDDLHKMADEFMKRYRKDKNYLQELIRRSEQAAKPMEDRISDIENISDLDDEELLKDFQRFSTLVYEAFGASHLIEGISLTTDVKIKDMLLKALDKRGMKDRFNDIFTKLTQPIRRFFLTDYNQSLAKIIDKAEDKDVISKDNIKSQELREMIREHIRRFYWIRSTFKSGQDLTFEDVIEEISNVIHEGDKLDITDDETFRNNLENKDRLIEELELPEELVDLIRITDVVTYWQDDRKINILKGCWGMDRYLKEISRRWDIDHPDLRYILPPEATAENLRTIRERLKKRREGCAIIYEKDVLEVYDGDDYLALKEKLHKSEDGSEHKEFNGMCASIGKATGRVKICRTTDDIAGFRKGDILVTSMTRPEYLPAMKKAAAIVTDEGGITCHAAVISRELGIPCVIGTKIASKVLKNGTLVEVNANHSQVKVIG